MGFFLLLFFVSFCYCLLVFVFEYFVAVVVFMNVLFWFAFYGDCSVVVHAFI